MKVLEDILPDLSSLRPKALSKPPPSKSNSCTPKTTAEWEASGHTVRRTRSLMRPASAKRLWAGTLGHRKLSWDKIVPIEESKILDHKCFASPTPPTKSSGRKRSFFGGRFKLGSAVVVRQASSCDALKKAVASLYNVEDFELTKIGEGFFCEVFKAVHTTTDKVMVLKMSKHKSNRTAMLKEMELLNTLSHPNILRYEAACVHEGQLHALIEFVNGGSLEQLIMNEHGALEWTTKVSLALDVARGMSYLHSQGYFHRDLTSKNVLVRILPDGKLSAVVADLGLAARIPKTKDNRLPQVGSPYWMSPECLKGLFYDGNSDIFSYGIILCELIAEIEADPDVLPRTENFGVDYMAFIRLLSGTKSETCPPQLLKLAFCCVQIDPESRPPWTKVISDLELLQDELLQTKLRSPLQVICSVGHPESSKAETPCFKIGKEMIKNDPHYIPSPGPGALNPFAELSIIISNKIHGKSSANLWCSCSDFETPKRASSVKKKVPIIRKSVSLVHRSRPSDFDEPSSAEFCDDIFRRLQCEDRDSKDQKEKAMQEDGEKNV